MKRIGMLLMLSAVLALGSCVHEAAAPFGATSFTPAYYEVGSPPPSVPQCAGIGTVTVDDKRPDPLLVGERFHEEHPADKFAIKSTSAPAAWVQAGIVEALKKATMPVSGAGKGNVVATIAAINLEEKAAWNAMYRAKVVLDVVVTKPGSAEACWTGRVEGVSENYGEAAKSENYAETMNHALDRALTTLMVEKGFLDGTCGACAAAKP